MRQKASTLPVDASKPVATDSTDDEEYLILVRSWNEMEKIRLELEWGRIRQASSSWWRKKVWQLFDGGGVKYVWTTARRCQVRVKIGDSR